MVDGRGTDGNRSHIANNVAIVHRHIRHAAADIHNGYTLLLLVGRQHSLGRSERVGNHTQQLDAHTLEGHLQTLNRGALAKDEVEGRRELRTERADGILHLLVLIDDIVLRDTLHDGLIVGSLEIAHAVEQAGQILLAHAILRIRHKDIIRMTGATHKVARDAGIGRRDADAGLLSGLLKGLTQRAAHILDILDTTGSDTLHGFRHQGLNLHRSIFGLGGNSDHDRRRTQIDGYNIILLFHGYYLVFIYSFFSASKGIKGAKGEKGIKGISTFNFQLSPLYSLLFPLPSLLSYRHTTRSENRTSTSR